MATQILKGKEAAATVLDEVRRDVAVFRDQTGRVPMLSVIQVGDDPASEVYIRNKRKAAVKCDVLFDHHHFPKTVSMKELSRAIQNLNESDECDGILVQLPLPPELHSDAVLHMIHPLKDADGFHPENIGSLWSGNAIVSPCTPAGILRLLDVYHIDPEGKHAVIIGRSNIVGKPVSALLLARNATVTMTHSRTTDLPQICRQADILVAAVGKPAFVDQSFIKPSAVVIDVGINRITPDTPGIGWIPEDSRLWEKLQSRGSALVGDVNPFDVKKTAAAYTPVPGGVGRMTVAMLLKNTVVLAFHRKGIVP